MPPASSSVPLCLACSASLPPRKTEEKVYYTRCCSRPICPKCVSSNPRLTRYNPCLRCLAGVSAVSGSINTNVRNGNGIDTRLNVDASIRDEDIFVLENEDEDEDEANVDVRLGQNGISAAEARGSEEADTTRDCSQDCSPSNTIGNTSVTEASTRDAGITPGAFPKYFIRSDDTLLGISLKLGLDAAVLCRLNNLPLNTLRTNPHLLHTRSFLVLPPSVRPPLPLSSADQAIDEEDKARLARERAETRFQAVTKEMDRDVAKVYVALAGLPDGEGSEFKEYQEEKGLRKRRVQVSKQSEAEASLEGRAVDQYYDDDEWEAQEQAAGRKPVLPSFPYVSAGSPSRPSSTATADEKSWWRWKS
ncbi:hypothetical protein BD414DRAFT_430027 [Trametes punicea]|nr:hypothetical protein BD414DRAFT_430027 [Trametes punicea]